MSSIDAVEQDNTFNIAKVRQDFPILDQKIKGKPLIYLDNAATTQKPQIVIDAINQFYNTNNANVHRGAHTLSDNATELFENARSSVQGFIHAKHAHEIVWTRGTTEAINTIASGLAQSFLKPGDEIIISAMEHHANIVPWQVAAQQSGAKLVVAPINEKGELNFSIYKTLLNKNTAVVAMTHVSNTLGTINQVKEIVQSAQQVNAITVIDGAQAIGHGFVDVQDLNCDFYVFSGHKLFGPTGIGVLYGKEAYLEQLPPFQTGGEMIKTVTFQQSTWNELPYKFEAGTPNIAGAIGLAAAIDYVNSIDRVGAIAHEQRLTNYCSALANSMDDIRIYGTAENKTAIFSFLIGDTHPSDVGTLLNQQGIAVRTGHHCTMPLMNELGISGTVRASFSMYNTEEEVAKLFAALTKLRTFL
ncbi:MULTISPECIES: aminotransferase class V-fold PLP-dependent enzyme [unclassified Colwellia]|uniref:aminotransferase class V-fold PLP-dependent enzyme n=1 Tax=unclassified Colwellia TaxID=196834 RepID=UPI0015F74549|nr:MULTISPECIES: SufS family cysteine desulfurase [unclassified Colwellia]MBA6232739.1 SufS family cysteine desulfurase [Colwellia sp. MB02u-7]MBA6236173.1 SufS family cysteine desulfurase [Colwellia sp. MB02u-11]MBA6298427.1 SufS family cysteine desulfurase [Colwellia sp. MB3u-22]MBA6304150.1 SufS family cysteine desulfurase [Colwellia sp. MB02u-14]MBA6311748.1 SufS family cysteine desulfurase [Colwellia sp. MB3u-64]